MRRGPRLKDSAELFRKVEVKQSRQRAQRSNRIVVKQPAFSESTPGTSSQFVRELLAGVLHGRISFASLSLTLRREAHLALLEQVESLVELREPALLPPKRVAAELAGGDEGRDVKHPATEVSASSGKKDRKLQGVSEGGKRGERYAPFLNRLLILRRRRERHSKHSEALPQYRVCILISPTPSQASDKTHRPASPPRRLPRSPPAARARRARA